MPLIRVLGQLGAKQFLCDKVLASVTRQFICYDTTPVHDNSKSRFHLEFSSMNYLLSVFHIIGGQTIHDLSIVLFLDKHIVMRCAISYHLCNLKNAKNTHGRVLLLVKKPATLLKVKLLLHKCFSRFSNCTNVTKLRKTSHVKIAVRIYSKKRLLEAYLEPSRISMMELFVKEVNGL